MVDLIPVGSERYMALSMLVVAVEGMMADGRSFEMHFEVERAIRTAFSPAMDLPC